MTNNDTLAAVHQFFGTVGYAGLILPSGWFGRPYDNLLQLTQSEVGDHSLRLELDGQLILTFVGEPQVAATEKGLRISGFTTLMWDWTEFDSLTSHHEDFDAGEVEFVAPMA